MYLEKQQEFQTKTKHVKSIVWLWLYFPAVPFSSALLCPHKGKYSRRFLYGRSKEFQTTCVKQDCVPSGIAAFVCGVAENRRFEEKEASECRKCRNPHFLIKNRAAV